MYNIEKLAIKLDDYAQLINLLSKDIEILNKVSRFKAAFKQLTSNQKKLVNLHAILSKDITTTEKVKSNRRKDLEEKTLQVIRIMQVFAYDKNKKSLQKQLECLSSEYVKNASDRELIKISKKIWLKANKVEGSPLTFADKIKSSLNPDNLVALIKFEQKYGLSPDMIKNIEEASIKFIESIHPCQSEMKEKVKAAEKIKLLKKQTEKLLLNNIDHFVLLFEIENPSFYNEYHQLRENQLPYKIIETLDQEQIKELMDQESDAKKSVVVEDPIILAEPKPRPKTARKANPENKVD